jgi:hypothetical protein
MKILPNQMVTRLASDASARRCTLAVATALLALTALPGVAEAKWDRTRLECSLDISTDYSLSVRYETRVRVKGSPKASRTKFSVEFEATAGIGFVVNDVLTVSVDTSSAIPLDVGTIKLVTAQNGDLVGEINYSSQAPSHQNGSKRPLPTNFPTLSSGDTVVISKSGTSLACQLS